MSYFAGQVAIHGVTAITINRRVFRDFATWDLVIRTTAPCFNTYGGKDEIVHTIALFTDDADRVLPLPTDSVRFIEEE